MKSNLSWNEGHLFTCCVFRCFTGHCWLYIDCWCFLSENTKKKNNNCCCCLLMQKSKNTRVYIFFILKKKLNFYCMFNVMTTTQLSFACRAMCSTLCIAHILQVLHERNEFMYSHYWTAADIKRKCQCVFFLYFVFCVIKINFINTIIFMGNG